MAGNWPRTIDLTPEARRNRREREMATQIKQMQNRQVLQKPQSASARVKPGPVGVVELYPLPLTGGSYLNTSLIIPSGSSRVSVNLWVKLRSTNTVGTGTDAYVGLYADGDYLADIAVCPMVSGTGVKEFVNNGADSVAVAPLLGSPMTFMVDEQSVFEPATGVETEFAVEFTGLSSAGAYKPFDVRDARLWVSVE